MGTMDWSGEPPWPSNFTTLGDGYNCGRCGLYVKPYWRHFWRPCRRCCIWSLAGANLMRAFGLDPTGNLYRGARPWCDDCAGSGFLPCEPQDLSIMRRSGACATCGSWSFVLFHCTNEDHSDIEGSARHYDDEADHEVIVEPAPLVRTLLQTVTRSES